MTKPQQMALPSSLCLIRLSSQKRRYDLPKVQASMGQRWLRLLHCTYCSCTVPLPLGPRTWSYWWAFLGTRKRTGWWLFILRSALDTVFFFLQCAWGTRSGWLTLNCFGKTNWIRLPTHGLVCQWQAHFCSLCAGQRPMSSLTLEVSWPRHGDHRCKLHCPQPLLPPLVTASLSPLDSE